MFMDADRQFDIAISALLSPFAGEYDIVAGFAWSERSTAPAVFAELFNISVRSSRVHLRDIDCAFKLFVAICCGA
jgi:hypothetical protein